MKNFHTGRDIGSFNSDLAIERHRINLSEDGVTLEKEERGAFLWERITVHTEEGERSIERPVGHYDTLTLPRSEFLSDSLIYDGADEISRELCRMFDKNRIFPERLLVVGLGNRELTPDSVGPRTAALTEATMHLKKLDPESFYSFECSEIAVIAPGVAGETGLETGVLIKELCESIRPDAVIAIDAVASSSPSRLGNTVQISDTGIFPGSGLGLRQTPLNKEALGVPVIAIGVPTVINAKCFMEGDSRNDDGNSMFVSPKDVDTVVKNASRIIAFGINQAFGIFT